jgi:exodeoxyribonuclease VII large subunit
LTSTPLLNSLFDELAAKPLSVTELNAEVRSLLERRFASVWVEGEIVNFSAASSGHWYFTLNDGTSQIKAACFRGSNYRIRFRPQNGMCVRVRGRISVYEQRGEYQLLADSIEPSGEGALRAAFEEIKARLEGEGLFQPSRKRVIPFFPRRVGIVTSPNGAAYHDIHNVLSRRASCVSMLLVPTNVQGEGAADNIRRAVLLVNRFNSRLPHKERIDVLIVGRGGGSAEDLWAFNDEALARAICASEIPVISAVGHEIDWTIADLVADLRAATPSAAAELVAQRQDYIEQAFEAREGQLESLLGFKVLDLRARKEDLCERMEERIAALRDAAVLQLAAAAAGLSPAAIAYRISEQQGKVERAAEQIVSALDKTRTAKIESLNLNMAKLDALSPLAVLTRGYSITEDAAGKVVRDPDAVQTGDKLKLRLERGKLNVEVLPLDRSSDV